VELLPVDKLKVLKQQILEQAGFDDPQMFPLFEDRFPTQVRTVVIIFLDCKQLELV
jgi:hypothetical protein